MKTTVNHLTALVAVIITQVWSVYPTKAQFKFVGVQPLTNCEVALRLSAPTGSGYRIDTTTDLLSWLPLVLVTRAIDTVQYTDSAAPYLRWRFYRAEQLGNTDVLLGDCLNTTNGDVVIRPLSHATFVMSWMERRSTTIPPVAFPTPDCLKQM